MPGEPVNIIFQNQKTKKFELDVKILENILLNEKTKDCEIVVVSVAGAFRKGKSFLLSFFLRYLEFSTIKEDPESWMSDLNAKLGGFGWKGGSKRQTTGILIWSEIFYYTKDDGTKVGIILMDTQGTFDTQSTVQDNVTIFAFSSMVASVQIYNCSQNIQEDNLQHLQLFTEYGKLAMEKSDGKPFQQLLFLIRDWYHDYEYSYGEKGGMEYLQKTLEIDNSQPEELRSLRMHIDSCFDKLNCFLAPHPGKKAASSKHFEGKISDLDSEFVVALKELVPMLLAKENLVYKKINGKNILAKELLSYIESYWKIFQDGKVPSPKSIFIATVEATCLSAAESAKELYADKMDEVISDTADILNFLVVTSTHEKFYKAAIDLYNEKAVLGDQSLKAPFKTKLENVLQKSLTVYLAKNDMKKSKNMEETIQTLNKQMEQYKNQNSESSESMKTVMKQMQDFQKSSAEEKERHLKEMGDLRGRFNQQQKGKKECCIL